VSGAPYLPDGFTGTFTRRYLDTAGLRACPRRQGASAASPGADDHLTLPG
jgi:hypothetical protein